MVGQKAVEIVPVAPPPKEQRVRRDAVFVPEGEKRSRYSLPASVSSSSPVGYRTRASMTQEQVAEAYHLLSMERPTGFAPPRPITERELFDECSLGILVARQSTNFRGHRQVTLGPSDSQKAAAILGDLRHAEGPVLDRAAMTHVVLSRPYRTPFTLLLTFVGHKPVLSLGTVITRALRKRLQGADDIPTIGYLQHLHIGVLVDAMERAAVVASGGQRRAATLLGPFSGADRMRENRAAIDALWSLCGLTSADRRAGWRVAAVVQVGEALDGEAAAIGAETCRVLGANLLSLRSERIQPGVNHEDKAPLQYHARQDMDVPDRLTEMCGRAAFNAFAHFTGCDRDRGKDLMVMDRIDVLTDGGKERLRSIRRELSWVTDKVIERMPLWADLPTGRAFTRNADRGRKAFALTGQRIYVAGLCHDEVAGSGVAWEHAVRGVGAAASRSALVAELAGVMDIPDGCDLLAGICLMAGPVNQNDIGKQFYGLPDLLAHRFGDRDPTSLLVWTLKAKTIADPIGNEEQLLNPARKGALVDLRPGPHEVVAVVGAGGPAPLRQRDGQVNAERAFAEAGNFVTDPEGVDIPGNRGEAWPEAWAGEVVWPS